MRLIQPWKGKAASTWQRNGKSTHAYTYIIEETLSRAVTISAATETEAYRILRDRYSNCDIVLDDSDYCSTEIYLADEDGTLEKKE